jgi:hypothetical protein
VNKHRKTINLNELTSADWQVLVLREIQADEWLIVSQSPEPAPELSRTSNFVSQSGTHQAEENTATTFPLAV